MSKTKILNLDEFKEDTRSIIFGNKARNLRQMSVGEFIDKSDDVDFEKLPPKEQASYLVSQAVDFVEDTTKEELLELTIDQLVVMLDFIRGEGDDKDAAGNELPKAE